MSFRNFAAFVLTLVFVFGLTASAMAFGVRELENEKIAVNFAREVERGGYKIVSTSELKGWIDAKKDMLMIDTMPYEASYKKEHIPGAKPMKFPIPEMTSIDDKTKAELEKLLSADKNSLVVFYCRFTTCTRSHNGAMWAVKSGYRNVYKHPGGIKAWKEADFPVGKVK